MDWQDSEASGDGVGNTIGGIDRRISVTNGNLRIQIKTGNTESWYDPSRDPRIQRGSNSEINPNQPIISRYSNISVATLTSGLGIGNSNASADTNGSGTVKAEQSEENPHAVASASTGSGSGSSSASTSSGSASVSDFGGNVRGASRKRKFDGNPHDESDLPNSNPFAQKLEEIYKFDRDNILQEDGFIMTPLNALREMGKALKVQLHFEYHEIHVGTYKTHMVELYVGNMIGYGESMRRKVAAQMAAADVLHQVIKRQGNKMDGIPPFGLVPGFRLSPLIFGDLAALCENLGFDRPRYIAMPIDPEAESPELYSFKCQVGALYRIADSDSRVLAKRWSAWFMFKALTNIDFPLDRVSRGKKNCTAIQRFGLKFPSSHFKLEALAKREQMMAEIKAKRDEAAKQQKMEDAMANVSVKEELMAMANGSESVVTVAGWSSSSTSEGFGPRITRTDTLMVSEEIKVEQDAFEEDLDTAEQGQTSSMYLDAEQMADIKQRVEKLQINV